MVQYMLNRCLENNTLVGFNLLNDLRSLNYSHADIEDL